MANTVINCEQSEQAEVVLLGAPYDRTSSFRKGADRGPAAIRACLDTQIELYDRISDCSPARELRIAWVDVKGLAGLEPEAMVERLTEEYRRHAASLRILIGGEHSVSNAAFRVHAEQASEITVLQIDAHADLRADDSDYNDNPWGPYAHCSVMRRAHDLGYRLVQVGVRAYSAAERELFDDERITVFEWGRARPTVAEVVEAIPTEKLYLTLDADGLDPACMPATGTPVPGGLDWYYTLDLLVAATRGRRLIGADLVEICPRDGDVRTEYAAAQLVYSLIGLAGGYGSSSLTR
jgi:agmatinase